MGKQFFNSWALWQKMTFVLACCIVLTIIIAFIKLQFDKRRLAKYSKVDKAKAAQTPEMLEAQRQEEEIPFGIRAIEKGVEVQGVWISRPNTPNGSGASSLNEVRISSLNGSHMDLPRPAYASSSRSSSRAPSSPGSAFDRAVSAERIPSDPSINTLTRNSTTLSALEGMAGPSNSRYDPSIFAHASSANSHKSSQRSSDEHDYMQIPLNDDRPYEPAYIKSSTAHPSTQSDPRYDLDLLHNHRLSHVAETGQLMPRVRKPGLSGEWASAADNIRPPDEISTVNGVNYFVPRQKTPSPPLEPVASVPQTTFTGPAYGRNGYSMHASHPPVPPVETYQPQPQAYQPRGPHHIYEEEGQSPDRRRVSTHQNQRESHVLRKVNSGFEILRPGTLPPPTAEELAEHEKRQSRKLQKKRRPSDASTTSHFTEHI